MPIVAVPMSPESVVHAQEVIKVAVSVDSTTTPPTITVIPMVKLLVDALHDVVAGSTVRIVSSAGKIRTIEINTSTINQTKRDDLEMMFNMCLAGIGDAESSAPGVILKV